MVKWANKNHKGNDPKPRPPHVIQIHVTKAEHIPNVGFLKNQLHQNGIEASVVVDPKFANRKYPYVTLDGKVMCVRRLIMQKREMMI
jgi:hypothetical protein